MDRQLIALYELKRQAFLFAYIQNPDHFDDALAYAYYHRVAPIFHETGVKEAYDADPFADIYSVSADFAEAVTKFIDRKWLAQDFAAIAFNRLEDEFGGYKAKRMELIHILEYTRIDGRFDDDVWKAIEHEAPIEARNLDGTFSPDDVDFS